MKYVVLVLTLFTAHLAVANEAGCPATTAQELRAILAQADAPEAAPCATTAAGMLVLTPDVELARSLFELAASDEESRVDTVPFSLALIFSAQPGMFATTLAATPEAIRCGVLDTVQLGLPSVKGEGYAQQAESREASLGELRQAYSCHAPPQEAGEQSSKQPSRYVPRSRRLRWVNLMTPVVNEQRALRT